MGAQFCDVDVFEDAKDEHIEEREAKDVEKVDKDPEKYEAFKRRVMTWKMMLNEYEDNYLD